jgi:hypothetical protein
MALPVPNLIQVNYNRWQSLHVKTMLTYTEEEDGYLRFPVNQQYQQIQILIQATNFTVKEMVKADHLNYKYALARLTQVNPSKINKKRKSKGHKPLPRAEWTENDLNSLLGTNWTELLQYLSNTNILLHTNLFCSCLEARLTIFAAASSRMNPRNKDQRRAWPLSLLNFILFPFPDTFFSDTGNIHEQATEELIFRDIWFQLFMTGNAVETATLG